MSSAKCEYQLPSKYDVDNIPFKDAAEIAVTYADILPVIYL